MLTQHFKTIAMAACMAPALLFGQAASAHGRQTFNEMAATYGTQAKLPEINYHGGPIMLGTNTLYIIYYGNFNDSTAHNDTKTIINDFFSSVGGSGNYNVNTVYFDSNRNHITNSLAFDPVNNVYNDNYSLGATLHSNDIEKIVNNAITGGHLPASPTALYAVITSPDSSDKLPACAYHSNFLLNNQQIIYAEVPDFGGTLLQDCSGSVQDYNEQNSRNDNLGADNVLDSFMHELSESVTDPLGNAWTSLVGGEIGDICNFNYGTTYIAPNGTHANTHLGNRDYLVQTIWEIKKGGSLCANSRP
jgi:hypothetical protein